MAVARNSNDLRVDDSGGESGGAVMDDLLQLLVGEGGDIDPARDLDGDLLRRGHVAHALEEEPDGRDVARERPGVEGRVDLRRPEAELGIDLGGDPSHSDRVVEDIVDSAAIQPSLCHELLDGVGAGEKGETDGGGVRGRAVGGDGRGVDADGRLPGAGDAGARRFDPAPARRRPEGLVDDEFGVIAHVATGRPRGAPRPGRG